MIAFTWPAQTQGNQVMIRNRLRSSIDRALIVKTVRFSMRVSLS
jgi:hypothetical protein